jgi:lysozyme family protein
MRGDDQPDQDIAKEMFDTGVNCGMVTVIKFLQRVLNVLNLKGMLYLDIQVDGICGRGTIETLKSSIAIKSWYRDCILKALDCLQGARYIELAERDSKFETFLPGWLRNRVGA